MKSATRARSAEHERSLWASLPTTELTAIATQWARMGAYFGAAPLRRPVDLEGLIVATARAAPDDERLFVVAASWLAVHHGFVNGRRLAALASTLLNPGVTPADREASAVLGAMLAWAADMAGGAEGLTAAAARCRPLAKARALFRVSALLPSVAERTRRNALPRFARWGLWHTDDTPKLAAVRPVAWLLLHAPELHIRAVAGPTLEADILAAVLLGLPGGSGRGGDRPRNIGVTARDVAGAFVVSYAAAHEGAAKLVGRGMLLRERQGARQVLRPTAVAVRLLD